MENKNYRLTLILATFLGAFGVHRFVNRKIGTGLLMFITFGGFGIWWLVDICMILSNKFFDAHGNKIGYEGKFLDMKFNVFYMVGIVVFFVFSILSSTSGNLPTNDKVQVEEMKDKEVKEEVKEEKVEELSVVDNRNEIQLVADEIFTIDDTNKGTYIVQKIGTEDFNTSILTINGKSTMGTKIDVIEGDLIMLTNTIGDAGIKLVPLVMSLKDSKTPISNSRIEIPLIADEIITIDDSNKGSYIVQKTGTQDFNTSILTVNGSSTMGAKVTLKNGDKIMLTNTTGNASITLVPSN